jgi:Tfp pilus assembly protein PilE
MKTLVEIIVAVAVIAMIAALVLPSLRHKTRERDRRAGFVPLTRFERFTLPFTQAMRPLASWFHSPPRANRIALANENLALQCRKENVRLKADAAVARYLLVKVGSDAEHGDVCGAADRPLGNSDDSPASAEDPFTVELFGLGCKERIVVASEAIAADVDVYTAASGKVQDEPAVAGTYYRVGRSSQSASANNDKVRIIPCDPEKVVVIAALGNANSEISAVTLAAETSTNGTAAAAAADLAALAAETEKIGDDTRDVRAKYTTLLGKLEELADDVRAMAAAQATPAKVKVLS